MLDSRDNPGESILICPSCPRKTDSRNNPSADDDPQWMGAGYTRVRRRGGDEGGVLPQPSCNADSEKPDLAASDNSASAVESGTS